MADEARCFTASHRVSGQGRRAAARKGVPLDILLRTPVVMEMQRGQLVADWLPTHLRAEQTRDEGLFTSRGTGLLLVSDSQKAQTYAAAAAAAAGSLTGEA